MVPLLQVLARYGEYGDSILGRFGVKDDGHKIPNVRAVIKPLIGLFYSEPGGRRWRNAIDRVLLQKPATVSEVIQVRIRPPAEPSSVDKPLKVLMGASLAWLGAAGGAMPLTWPSRRSPALTQRSCRQ